MTKAENKLIVHLLELLARTLRDRLICEPSIQLNDELSATETEEIAGMLNAWEKKRGRRDFEWSPNLCFVGNGFLASVLASKLKAELESKARIAGIISYIEKHEVDSLRGEIQRIERPDLYQKLEQKFGATEDEIKGAIRTAIAIGAVIPAGDALIVKKLK
jgi:hypothetical protein